MRWYVAPGNEPDRARVTILFEPDDNGSPTGRTTLSHLTSDAGPVMERVISALHDGQVELDGLLWRRHVSGPHGGDQRQLLPRLDVLRAEGFAIVEQAAAPSPTDEPPFALAHKLVVSDLLVACELALNTVSDPHANLRIKVRSHLVALRSLVDLPFDDEEGVGPAAHQEALRTALRKLFESARTDRTLIPFLDELHAHVVELALPMRQALRGEGPDDHKIARYAYGELLDREGGAWMSWRLHTR